MNTLYRRGQSGNQIEQIQRRLAEIGLYPGPIDGIFGPLTLEAVRELQTQHALPVDGVVGPQTWQVLFVESRGGAIGTPDGSRHTGTVFICYRRDDSADVVGRIYDRLVERFGRDAVFKGVDTLPLGVDFRQHLHSSLARFGVILVVIGPEWLSAEGRERLGQERDLVRFEIESGFELGVAMIPLLLQGAPLPKEEDLPPSIAQLAHHNGLVIRPDPDFHHDITQLIDGVQRIIDQLREGNAERQRGDAQGQQPPAN